CAHYEYTSYGPFDFW
nr:immunoglobulin heavy chain junction region [Macaca mulatta]MOW88457.1 immunoglobulin heavy chain junction region [Macaca mulatta]MOW89211.1 immunoglobulin heavy chain junction region [Macaca mulatta]MOW90106.1 immunoglobulin heavy chain junction region [Macaca mulatta]MOW91507.1 immunoglobulin heavy chain junction region [Macaca mulatta]